MKLVIVESPSKAKTIEKYLGSEYIVRSSIGHIRDLPKSNKDAIDIDGGFVALAFLGDHFNNIHSNNLFQIESRLGKNQISKKWINIVIKSPINPSVD